MTHRVVCRVLVLAVVLSICGCASRPEHGSSPPDAVIIGLEGNPTSLDPRVARDAYSTRILPLLFHGLMRLNEKSELVPELAASVRQPDELTYEFTLREDVFFASGRRVNAHDVEYTLKSLADPALRSPRKYVLERIEQISALSNNTIRIKLKGPYAPFLSELTLGVVPAEEAASQGAGFSRHPTGSGPYLLESWEQGGEIVLVRNPHFQGWPVHIPRLVFRVIPDDVTRVLALERGEVHLLLNSLPPDDVPLVKKNPRLRVFSRPGINYSYLGFNLQDPILAKRKVRQAIALAIDREPVIHCLLQDTVREATGLLAPEHWAYEPEVDVYHHDLEKARALLDQAGFPDPDGPGPRPRFRLLWKTSQNKTRLWIAQALAYQLKEAGIAVEVRSYEWGTLFADIVAGNFQIYSLTWVGITEPDIYYNAFHSRSVPPEGANRGRYVNPQIDALAEQARKIQDQRLRKNLYSQIQKIVAHDLPYVSLWYADDIVALDRRLTGFELFPGGDFRSLAQVRWSME